MTGPPVVVVMDAQAAAALVILGRTCNVEDDQGVRVEDTQAAQRGAAALDGSLWRAVEAT